MTNTLSVSGITGTDGIVPVFNPNNKFTIYSLAEIYTGQQGQNRYVPNLNDRVIDLDTNKWYYVHSIDPSTLIAELVPVTTVDEGDFSPDDLLLGVGPGTQSDTYRLYIDKSVQPFTMAVDARLHVAGTMVKTAKIFRGSELTGTARVISAYYDQSGTVLGQAIPLELVAMPNGQNYSIKTVPVCYTVEDIPDGEVVTAVFYSDTGHVVSKRQLLVENTAFIRSADSSVKYITGIALESPFLSETDPTLIQYPLNVPLVGLNLIGVVKYSDGSVNRMPVDNTKFSIFGFENYAATIVGQKFPLVIKYTLSPDEIVYGANVGDGRFITESYKATTIKADGAFTIKLFGYPVWVDAVTGYVLRWYMYNLERNVAYNVTPYVRFNSNTRVFDPLAFGVTQHLSVSINLKDVNGIYPNYIHVQTLDIVLMGPGTQRTTNWTVGFDPNQDPMYGVNVFASTTFINQNLTKLKIDAGSTAIDDWLARLYYNTKPLVDINKEITAPAPDYFSVYVNNQDIEFPISQWGSELLINGVLSDNSTLFVKFFKRLADNDIQLGVAGLPVYQTN